MTLAIEEIAGVKFAMTKCPRCGLPCTAIEKHGRYELSRTATCHAISVHEVNGKITFEFPKEA